MTESTRPNSFSNLLRASLLGVGAAALTTLAPAMASASPKDVVPTKASRAQADAPLVHALRLSIGFGPSGIYRTDEPGANSVRSENLFALGGAIDLEYLHTNGHGAFGRAWGATELSPDLEFNLLSDDVEPTYDYQSGGFALGYRVQFEEPRNTGFHYVQSLYAGPAMGWTGFDAEEGYSDAWFGEDESIPAPGPVRSHFGVGGVLGGYVGLQRERLTLGFDATYTQLWTVVLRENSMVARDGVFTALIQLGFVTAL